MQIPGTDVAFLSRFVPRHAQRMLSERTELPSSEEESFVLGAAFVADIAGFTALTEMLDITQDEGADVLSEALQRIFVSLDDIVGRHGGEVVHLAGDGLFAIWPVAHSDRLAHAVGRSVACGLEIQSEAPGIDVLEGQRLRLRVGVGAGSLWLPVVGGFGARWAAPVGGAPLQQISTALDAARPGDVVVSSEAVALAGNTLSGAVTPAGLMRIEAADLPPPNEGVRGEPMPTALLEHFVPEIVAARASAGLTGRFAELRQATSVFAKVHSLDADAPHRLVRLQEMTIAFQESVRRYDGAVTVTLLDEVGLSLVGTWGGSRHAHEDDAVRALRAAMDFTAVVDDFDLGVGVATGRTFMGDVESGRARRFLLLGRSVNLAARLAAPDSNARIRCDVTTMIAARRNIAFEEQPALYLKGVAESTRVYRPVAAIESIRGEGPGMVGRFREREVLSNLFERFLGGTGATAVIEGEAGIGKSTLVREVLREAETHPVRRLVVRGSALDASTPYQPWMAVFRTLIGGADPDGVVSDLLPPSDRDLAGLLAPVLQLSGSVSARVQAMTPGDRAEAARDLLCRLFSSLVGDSRLILILEDAHWYDTATWALAEDVIERRPDSLVIVVTRGSSEVVDPSERRVREEAPVLRLESLTSDETVALACDRLDVPSIPARLAQLIKDRTEGHPLFTEELIRAFRDASVIEILDETRDMRVDWDALDQIALPSSVAAVIASRVDRLPLEHQHTLKVASVIGRDFSLDLVHAIHPEGLTAAEIKEHFEVAASEGLVSAHDLGSNAGYRFAHVLTADATYGLLPAETRQSMHLALANVLEGDAEAPPALRAHHWAAAGDREKASLAFDEAADAAYASAGFREAAALCEKASELDGSGGPSLRRARRHLILGEASVRLGELHAGHEQLVAATAEAGMPMPSSRWRLALGLLWQILRQVLHRLTPLPRRVRRDEDIERVALGAEAYVEMLWTTFGLHDALGLSYVGLRATNEAEQMAPTNALAFGYSFLAYTMGLVGWRGSSDRYQQRSLDAAAAAESPAAVAEVTLNHAVLMTALGQWAAADADLTDAAERYRLLGKNRDHARAVSVQAFGAVHCGRFDEGLRLYQVAGEIESDDDLMIVWRQVGTGKALVRTGRLTEALGLLSSFAHKAEEVGEFATILSRLGFLGVALWQEGRLDAAVDAALEGLDLMEGTETMAAPHSFDGFAAVTRVLLDASAHTPDPALAAAAARAVRSLKKVARRLPLAVARATSASAILAARAGRSRRARRGFERALAKAEELGMPYEGGLVLLEMGRAFGDAAVLRQAEVRLAGLGAARDARIAQLVRAEA